MAVFAQRSVPEENDLAVREVKRGLPCFSSATSPTPSTELPLLPNVMGSYDNFDSQIQQLEGDGIMDLGIFSDTGPQTFPSQAAAPHGPPPGFHAPEFPSQPRGYAPRSYGYQGFPRSFPLQAHDAGRPVNIVLPGGGTEAQSLLILSSKVERLEREMQELTRAVVRFQEETKASLERVKEGLDNFMSSITIADEQPGETPREEAAPGAAQMT